MLAFLFIEIGSLMNVLERIRTQTVLPVYPKVLPHSIARIA